MVVGVLCGGGGVPFLCSMISICFGPLMYLMSLSVGAHDLFWSCCDLLTGLRFHTGCVYSICFVELSLLLRGVFALRLTCVLLLPSRFPLRSRVLISLFWGLQLIRIP